MKSSAHVMFLSAMHLLDFGTASFHIWCKLYLSLQVYTSSKQTVVRCSNIVLFVCNAPEIGMKIDTESQQWRFPQTSKFT